MICSIDKAQLREIFYSGASWFFRFKFKEKPLGAKSRSFGWLVEPTGAHICEYCSGRADGAAPDVVCPHGQTILRLVSGDVPGQSGNIEDLVPGFHSKLSALIQGELENIWVDELMATELREDNAEHRLREHEPDLCAICITSAPNPEIDWTCKQCSKTVHQPCMRRWISTNLNGRAGDCSKENCFRCPMCRHMYSTAHLNGKGARPTKRARVTKNVLTEVVINLE